jgi:hypothetical protein
MIVRPVHVVDGRVDEVQDARAEQHADGGHVVHEARHQVARLALLVEGERQRLQVREQVVPQVVLDVAADVEDDEARVRPGDRPHERDQDDQAESIARARAAAASSRSRSRCAVEPRQAHRERRRGDEAAIPPR